MFSSFKEKLNTSLSTLQEKGLSTTLSTTHATNHGPGPGLDTAGTGIGTAGQTEAHVPIDSDGTSGTETAPGSGPGHFVVVPVKTADLTSLASPHSPTPSVPHHQHQHQQQLPLQQHQGSFGSIASRISSGASSSSLFFRRPLQSTRSTADLIAAGTTAASSPSLSYTTTTGTAHFLDVASGISGPNRLAILVQRLTLDPQEEKADPAELDKVRDFYNQQQEQQPSGTELSTVVIEKLEILRRYEARFPGEKNSSSSSSNSISSSSNTIHDSLKKKGATKKAEEVNKTVEKAGVRQMNPNEHESEFRPIRKSRIPRGMLLPPLLTLPPCSSLLPLLHQLHFSIDNLLCCCLVSRLTAPLFIHDELTRLSPLLFPLYCLSHGWI